MIMPEPKAPQLTHKITVVFTDIADSSIFFKMYGDLAGRQMLEKHNEMLIPIVKEHGGVVVKTLGDSIMAYFLNPVEALKSTIKIQKTLTQFNLTQEEDHEIHVRIAIHHGSGLIEREDVFGDVVNVAAKILPLVEPDTIYVSEAVKLLVGDAIPLQYVEILLDEEDEVSGQRIFEVAWEDGLDLLPVTNIIVLVNPVPFLGEKAFGKKWPFFLQAVYSRLDENAIETKILENKMFLSHYYNLPETLLHLVHLLSDLHKNYLVETPLDNLPLQIILHKDVHRYQDDSFVEALSIGWENLKAGAVYLTKPAYDYWLENRPADCSFKVIPDGPKTYRVETEEEAGNVILFPHREIMIMGQRRECFYCGSRRHRLSACPSKNLHLPSKALIQVGYLSIENLNSCFSEAFNNPDQYNEKLANLKESDFQAIPGKNAALIAYHTFFDLMEAYQMRFMRRIWRAETSSWNSLPGTETGQKEEGGLLWLALDCIRVGQLEKAEYFLQAVEDQSGKGYRRHLVTGFLHLDKENYYEALYQFERAKELSENYLQRIYVLFLIARIHEILDDYSKAEELLNSIIFLDPECLEAHYRKVVLLAKMGLYESAMNRLRGIIRQRREFFLYALIDPQLLQMQRIVEPLLAQMLEDARLNATEIVQRAEVAVSNLGAWMEKEDEAYEQSAMLIDKIRYLMAQNSYLCYLEAEDIARTLVNRCRMDLVNMKVNLEEEILSHDHKMQGYELYWNKYPLKGLFRITLFRLQQLREKINWATALVKRDEADMFKRARNLAREISSELEEIASTAHRMELAENFVQNIHSFGKRALILEAAMFVLVIAVYPIILFYINRFYPLFEWNTFDDIWQYQKGALAIGSVAGFLIAAVLTLRDIWRS